jgi:hypothetical protein
MSRRKSARRFREPRLGVNALMVEEEAKTLSREADDYSLLAPARVQEKLAERNERCRHSWQHLQRLLVSVPEHQRQIMQCLLLRDFYHILELYLWHVRGTHPESPSPIPPAVSPKPCSEFSEWLFE